MERQTIAANFWVAPSKVRRNGLAPINVTITRNGQRASFSTGRMIRPDNWDSKRQRAKGKSEEAIAINTHLQQISIQLQQKEDDLISKGYIITADLLRDAMLGKIDALQPNDSFSTGLTVWNDIAQQPRTESRVIPLSANRTIHSRHFIEANTKAVDISHLREDCIVPVFSKDNELTISHQMFIETILGAAYRMFPNEAIDTPDIVVSHIIKGRIPEAIHKPVSQLLETDKTIYYERMAFCFEIPTIYEDVAGNRLNLSIGGVRAYNHENLYSRKTMERFKVFIGFKNLVCCNLCVSTDGLKSDMRVMSVQELFEQSLQLFQQYNAQAHLSQMSQLQNRALTEHQFAQLIGKTRLYQFLPPKERKALPAMEFTDSHINAIARAYYSDENFGRIGIVENTAPDIDLWRVYNLFTGANKSSYIDTFLDRSLNATNLITGIGRALEGDSEYAWFIE